MTLPPELLEQLRKLRSDLPYYAARALKIRDKAGSIVPLRLNRAQTYLHEQVEKQLRETGMVRIIGLKGRQQGFSTYVEARLFWRVSMGFGKRAFILTHLAEATSNLFGVMRRFYEFLPDSLRPSVRQLSSTGIEFDKLASEVSVATAGSTGTGRSATAQYFHGSEVAYWPSALEHMAGIGQIVPRAPGTEIILESTANGVGNLFHGMCMDALAGRGDYRLVFVPWYWQDEYSLEPPKDWKASPEDEEYGRAYKLTPGQVYWRRRKIETDFRGDESLFDQEYPATVAMAFARSSGEPFIPLSLVVRARKTLHVEGRGARIMGLDPAEYGVDDTVLIGRVGRDASTLYQRWNGKSQMAIVGAVARIADRWRPDVINIDVTGGYGSGIADRLRELGYPVQRINFGARAIQDDKYPRRLDEMWGEMKAWLEDEPCKIPDDDLLQTELCMRQFTYDSSRRIVLESKERMKKTRGLKSPDGADALALTFAMPVRPKVARVPRLEPFANPGGMGY